MDIPYRRAISSEMDYDVRAELLSLPWRLSHALAEAPFILTPGSALSLPVRAKAAAERAMRLATVTDRTTTRTLPQLLANNKGGAVNRLLTSASETIDGNELAQSEQLNPRELKAELADVIEKLASFQISRFRTQDFKLALLLAERCVHRHGESSRGSSEHSAAVTRSVRAFRDWMREAVNVLEEAWKQHRVKIDVDDLHEQGESQQRSCYSKAPEVDYYSLSAQEDEDLWLRLFPIPRWAIFDANKETYDEYIYETRVNRSRFAGGVAAGGSYRVIDLLDDKDRRDAEELKNVDDNDWMWFVTPRLGCSLYTTLLRVAYDDDDTFLEARIPEIAKPYCKNDRWMENMQQCALRLAARLEKGIDPYPNCIGEAAVLHIIFDYGLLLGYIDFKPEIFCSTKDGDLHVEVLEDVVRSRDIFNPVSSVCGLLRVPNMHPAEWFKPFDPNRFLEHIMISPECRPKKVEHAIAVLSKARRPKQDSHDRLILSKIVSYLDDSDIIRLTCCGKANGA